MMDAAIVFLFIVSFACGAPVKGKEPYALKDDFQDFLELVPFEKMIGIVLDYVDNDEEVQAVHKYLMSDELKDIVVSIDSKPDTKEMLNYLQAAGLDVYELLNVTEQHLLISNATAQRFPKHRNETWIFQQLLVDVRLLLYRATLVAMSDKLDMNDLCMKMHSNDFRAFVETVGELPETRELLTSLRCQGVDVNRLLALGGAVFGWTAHTSSGLNANFNQLLDVRVLKGIIGKSLPNYKGLQSVAEFVNSEGFKNFVLAVELNPKFWEIVNYFYYKGVDIYGLVNSFHSFLDIPEVRPPIVHKSNTGNRTIRQMLGDLKAILPLAELGALFNEKLETIPEFKVIFDNLGNETFEAVVKKVRDLPETQQLVSSLRGYGVDVEFI